MGQVSGAECRRKSEGGRQRHRDRSENCREHQGNDFRARHLQHRGIDHKDDYDTAAKDGEIADNAENGLLLGALDVCGSNQLGGAAKLCLRSSRSYLGRGFAPPHRRACIGLEAGTGFNRYRFACEH